MGSHRKIEYISKIPNVPENWPPLPDRKKKTLLIRSIDGTPRHFYVVDEIKFKMITSERHLCYVQKLRYQENNEILFRFGYYMIGVKEGRMKGKWVWGQFCPFFTKDDLLRLDKEMKARGWIELKEGKE
jgi:hypothetical protein